MLAQHAHLGGAVMGTFFYRLMGAAILDAGAYEGIENDPRATGQAAMTVVLASVAAGVGAAGVYGPSVATLLTVSTLALVTWAAWAVLVLQIGARWLREPDTQADTGQLLRTIGFAASPGLLQVLAAFPRVAPFVFALTWLWMLAAMVVAVRHALDYRSSARAVAVCLLAAGLVVALAAVIGVLFGRPVG
jgi:hypothetical protein